MDESVEDVPVAPTYPIAGSRVTTDQLRALAQNAVSNAKVCMDRAREDPGQAAELVALGSRFLSDYNDFAQDHARVVGGRAVESRFPGAVVTDVYPGGDCLPMAFRITQSKMTPTVSLFHHVTPRSRLAERTSPPNRRCHPLPLLITPYYRLLPRGTPCLTCDLYAVVG